MKILTVTVPCYNSQEYMERCIKSLLVGGDDIEILIVDDGSTKDDTLGVAKKYEETYPGIVRAIHQENKGHGGAVNTGIENAAGKYFKVVDSDDKVQALAFSKVIETLKALEDEGGVDMFLSNYIYDKEGAKRKALMRYAGKFPEGRIFTWDESSKLGPTQYVLMHSIIYRTELLRENGFKLPEHTFYVDNLYAFLPIPYVEKLYYLNVNLYMYYIGRADQSVNESIMISRLDQQLLINRIMIDCMSENGSIGGRKWDFMVHSLGIIMTVSSIMCIRSKDEKRFKDKDELWALLKEKCPREYLRLRWFITGIGMNVSTKLGRTLIVGAYKLTQKRFGFN